MRRLGVNIACNDIGFDFVSLHACAGLRAIDRIQHAEKLGRPVAIAENSEPKQLHMAACVYCPPFSRTPGTLAFDVPGFMGGTVEWRRKE